jgi:hypothetical protein
LACGWNVAASVHSAAVRKIDGIRRITAVSVAEMAPKAGCDFAGLYDVKTLPVEVLRCGKVREIGYARVLQR